VLCFRCGTSVYLLKGFFDRVFLPGVSFDLGADGRIGPRLQHIRKFGAIATYAATRPVACYMGDPTPPDSARAACAV
jgi:NAD(P)H dehydrogenase (quinone)